MTTNAEIERDLASGGISLNADRRAVDWMVNKQQDVLRLTAENERLRRAAEVAIQNINFIDTASAQYATQQLQAALAHKEPSE